MGWTALLQVILLCLKSLTTLLVRVHLYVLSCFSRSICPTLVVIITHPVLFQWWLTFLFSYKFACSLNCSSEYSNIILIHVLIHRLALNIFFLQAIVRLWTQDVGFPSHERLLCIHNKFSFPIYLWCFPRLPLFDKLCSII